MERNYQDFLKDKAIIKRSDGRASGEVHARLFPFQAEIVRWACRKGRAAIFADTGLGKTIMQVAWANAIGERTLFIAPLAVSRQTIREAELIGVGIKYLRDDDLKEKMIITNYEMADHFNPDNFGAVVLDESSILKSIAGKTREKLIRMFANTPFRLCCTATPAPNDIAEIANHSEFLGIMRRVDMLATYFVHDEEWRLKGHAEDPFYRWMASWAMSVKYPSDIGFSDEGYILPELQVKEVEVKSGIVPKGYLFFNNLKGIEDRINVRKSTIKERCDKAIEMVTADGDPWILWHGLNEEGDYLAKNIPGSVLVEGSQEPEDKAEKIEAFVMGKHRVLITKPKIAGFGMNYQHCHKMAFVGIGDSFESYYQCIRRCYRFGQKHPVSVHVIISDLEHEIIENVKKKEKEAERMTKQLIAKMKNYEVEELKGKEPGFNYATKCETGNGWKIFMGDSCEEMKNIQDGTVGLSIFSPPFMSLYTYSATERDVGNSKSPDEFWGHFDFIIKELLRVTKPGRNCAVHVSQVPAMLVRDGYIGLKDFRGQAICKFQDNGWVYHGEVCIDKDPQAQAIRTKARSLLFVQLKKDSSWLRPALADYILVFRKPGENMEPIHPDLSNEEWIEWARPIWYGIHETETLNARAARDEKDERHICPLQLGVIRRCLRLWSNKGDVIFSPFMGIGSEGYEAIKNERNFIGIELKPEYFAVAKNNLLKAEKTIKTLF